MDATFIVRTKRGLALHWCNHSMATLRDIRFVPNVHWPRRRFGVNDVEVSERKNRYWRSNLLLLIIAGLTAVSAMMLTAVTWLQLVSSSSPNFLFESTMEDENSLFDGLRIYQVEGISTNLQSITLRRCYGFQEGEHREIFLDEEFRVEYKYGVGEVVGIARYVESKCQVSGKILEELVIDIGYSIRTLGIRIHETRKLIHVMPTSNGSDDRASR